MLFASAVAHVSCADCQRFVYDLQTGKRETYQAGSAYNELPVPRNGPPPCELGRDCPKESPEREHLHVLNARNRQMVDLYFANRAFGGNLFQPHQIDPLRTRAFQIIDEIVREQDRQDLARAIAVKVGPFLIR